MDSAQAVIELRAHTDDWVDSLFGSKQLASLKVPDPAEVKIIRDAVTGYQVLKPYEYLVLNHPIFQRLRYIHQTALTFLVYPSAHHTRFDHSLGCAKIAQTLGDHLDYVTPTSIAELRLAALLHDVGHTFLSHLSETIIQSHFSEQYFALKESAEFSGLNLSLSEMMSYFIITSKPFSDYLRTVVHHYDDTINLVNVANFCIHNPPDEIAFLGDAISGPFDVDKLDYLVRDCYHTGIRADVDVERVVVSAVPLDEIRFPPSSPRWKRRSLVIKMGGVSILEQITFNKMLLFPSVYHHHKIRAIECMIKTLFEIIWENGGIKNPSLQFSNIIDFYALNDYQFMSYAAQEASLEPYMQRIMNRELYKRCLALSQRYVKEKPLWKHLRKRHYEDNKGEIRRLRQQIYDQLDPGIKEKLSVYDVWVDIPKTPSMGDPSKAFVDIGTKELTPLKEFFPYELWHSAYESNKLKGHVFSLPDDEIRGAVNKSAIAVFREEFGLEFVDRATQECKL